MGLTLLMAATACGGGGGKAPSTAVAAAGDTSTTTVGGRAAYTDCMRKRGVNLPDQPARADGQGGPGSGTPGTGGQGGTPGSRPPGTGTRPTSTLPAGVDRAAFDAARQACQSLLPADRGNGPQNQNPAFQAYSSCLKDHGVVVPSGGGLGGLNRDDAAFKAADSICAPLRPGQP